MCEVAWSYDRFTPCVQDILYQWPKSGLEEEYTLDSLMQLRGLFLTLADLLGEMTGAKSFW